MHMLFRVAALLPLALSPSAASPPDAAQFSADGKLAFPAGYREWVFLSSGRGMSYNPTAQSAAEPAYDNVFVNREAHAEFLKTRRWPDGTVLVLEIRGGTGHGSINKGGSFQSGDPIAVEVHLKDRRRYATQEGWAFFGFDGKAPAPAAKIDEGAACYACHVAHGAVDRTFVQFYPTLLPLARAKGTLSPAYLRDEAEAATPAP